MRIEDMILVSVDDHVIEPPDMFDGRLPAKYQDLAPKLIRRDDGTDYWHYDGSEIPNVGLNAVVGPAHPRSTASSPAPSTRCARAATTSTSGCAT